MIAFILFFIDFIGANFFQQWIVQSLLVYIVGCIVLDRSRCVVKPSLILSIGLFVLQDYAVTGHFGLCLIYLLPLILYFNEIRALVHLSSLYMFLMAIVYCLCSQAIIVNKCILGYDGLVFVTSVKIFVNLFAGMMVFLGMRGGRSLLALVKKERKVWTPNRIDAS